MNQTEQNEQNKIFPNISNIFNLNCFPNSKYYITDAIPHSTFYSRMYLNEYKDSVINLHDIHNKLLIDIEVNIHSFPECNIDDIEW